VRSNSSYRSRRPGGRQFSFQSAKARPPRNGRGGQYIHPDKFVNKALAEKITEEAIQIKHSFDDFKLLPELLRNLTSKGYTIPTPIQDQAILPILEGHDLIGLANTGTGKTAAFLLPSMQRLKIGPSHKTMLVIAPTRELAAQINDDFMSFGTGLSLFSTLCVGGMSIERQVRELRRRPRVIIGTPGRLKDLVTRRVLRLNDVGVLVLDEVDRMLDMGFLPDVRFLLAQITHKPQSLAFSATITAPIQSLLDDMLSNPIKISVRVSQNSYHIEQDVIKAGVRDEKVKVLTDLLRKPDFVKVLVFGKTKHGVQRLADSLDKQGIPSQAIHGNKSQPQRQKALRAFKEGRVRVLVATDVAARGLDIPNVSHVINFDQPATYDDYLHRIGRTGRAGKTGNALTFI
jgi:superfamily II DNA/RNA helicase